MVPWYVAFAPQLAPSGLTYPKTCSRGQLAHELGRKRRLTESQLGIATTPCRGGQGTSLVAQAVTTHGNVGRIIAAVSVARKSAEASRGENGKLLQEESTESDWERRSGRR